MEHNFIEDELVILTKQTIDIFLRQENPADLIALYSFYYYTAKWQGTNRPKCTTDYVSHALCWSSAKVRKVKRQLVLFGVIEDVAIKDNFGKISGHYIKMNYVFKKSTLKEIHTVGNPQCGEDYTVENLETNALSTNNINALSTNNKNALSTCNNIPPISPKGKTDCSDLFNQFWSAYPKHIAKQSAVKAFEKLKPDEKLLEAMLKAIAMQKESKQWEKDGGAFIPYPATWLNQRRWEDELPQVETDNVFLQMLQEEGQHEPF